MTDFDFDYIVIGSGFGGSVSAMRLSQKGYRVAVLESGKRWQDQDFPKTNWQVNKFLWLPQLFCYGIQRINLLKDVMILSGAGVGGGSLVYANTLYVPLPAFFEHPTIQQLGGSEQLLPYYGLAQKMLGVTENPRLGPVDELLRQTAESFGTADSFKPTPAGVYFGEPNAPAKDPYFEGEGPQRKGCLHCGACMVGCRHNAKNTLVKNYLYFAEQWGTHIFAETQVTDILPLSEDGSAGYQITTRCPTGWGGYPHRKFRCRGVVLSAGVLGTLGLLLKLKENGRLPRLSAQLGQTVRTNSEAILGAIARDADTDYTQGIAITSSVYPDAHSHMEPVRYPRGSDVMGLLATLLTDGGGKIPRQLRFLGNILKQPLDFARTILPFGFARKAVILLFMQTLDNSIQVVRTRRWFWPFGKILSSDSGDGEKSPSYIPLANEFARRYAAKMNALPASAINEVLLDIPTTAHILGGCGLGATPTEGVADLHNRIFGYQNLLVCDGSMIPANLGVNPSLSITAFAERAMAAIPPKQGPIRWLKAEQTWGVTHLIAPTAHEPMVEVHSVADA